MLALLDGDILAYRTAAVAEKHEASLARWQLDTMVSRIIEDVDASDWAIWISGDTNFRYKLFPDYKDNRRDKPRPRHLDALREHLVLEWDAQITDGIEADDALGIASQAHGASKCVVCSIDKDLRQLPGQHYHFVNREWVEVSSIDAWRNFYSQLLIGDSADNISGCPGIGPVKGARAVEYLTAESAMYEKAKSLYVAAKVSIEQMHLNAQLLYVHRKENDSWTPPTSKQEAGQTLLSSPSSKESSSEHGSVPTTNGTPADGS